MSKAIMRPKAVGELVCVSVGPVSFRYRTGQNGEPLHEWEVKLRGEDDGTITAPLRSTPTELVRHWQTRDTDRLRAVQTRGLLEAMANELGGEFEVVESSLHDESDRPPSRCPVCGARALHPVKDATLGWTWSCFDGCNP